MAWVALALGMVVRLSAAAAQPAQNDSEQEPVDPYAAPKSGAPPAIPAEPKARSPGDGSSAQAPPEDELPATSDNDDVDDQVARALYRRGVTLYRRGATTDAKTLFVESLERSPSGPIAGEALRMLRAANRRLGIANQDDGRPAPPGQDAVLDPYGPGAPAANEGPLDPYGAAPPRREAPAPAETPTWIDESAEPRPSRGPGRMAVIAWSGAVGLVTGLALAGPNNDSGELADGAAVAGVVGAAGGVGLAYWLTGRTTLSAGQSAAISSGATWGAAAAGLLGDATTGTDSESNDVWKYVAAGGLVGLGGGVLYARAADPSLEDMAVTDSLGLLGATAGLCIAAGLEPPASEAFSLNALFGGAAGLTAGILLSPRVELSLQRTMWIDLGAVAGAGVAWALLYPLIIDDSSRNDEQITGWVSTVTLLGGATTAWFLTRNLDGPRATESLSGRRRAPRVPAPPALARRQADGEWELGVPFVRPLHSRAQAVPGGGMALGIDLVAGSF